MKGNEGERLGQREKVMVVVAVVVVVVVIVVLRVIQKVRGKENCVVIVEVLELV